MFFLGVMETASSPFSLLEDAQCAWVTASLLDSLLASPLLT